MADNLAKWRAANPWVLKNLSVIGQACGRYPTEAAAVQAAAERGKVVETNRTSRTVSFTAPVYL